MAKTQVSFNMEESTLLEVKKIALEKGTTATDLYNRWILEGIKKETSQTKLD